LTVAAAATAALTDTRQQFNSLFALYVAIAVVIAAIVFALVFFALLRYRRREGRRPSRRSEANLLEGIAAAVIVVIVAVILTATFSTESKVDATPRGSLQVRVTAFQWGWRFDYPGEGVSVIGDSNHEPVLGVPAGREISFAITSRDVIHAFWVPSERFKRDAFPDRVNRFDLVFDQPGGHAGECAEFCGLRHTDMLFRVLVLGEADFNRWLAVQRSNQPPSVTR
jgi:cytochrome c oxidase subunit 2